MILYPIEKLIAAGKSSWVLQIIAFIRDLLFGYILLLASAILPICGWHRVWLRLGWWWLYPLTGFIISFGYFIGQKWLMLALPGLIIGDSLALWQVIAERHWGARK